MRHIQLLGIGKYLPNKRVTASELDAQLQKAPGTVLKATGVASRYYVEGETASEMGAIAAQRALKAAGLKLSDIDCIVCANATKEQAIPSTATLISKQLGLEARGVPAFDIDAACLSFVVALDMMSYVLAAGRFKHIMIISSEIASVGLDWNDLKSCALFGDGAVATIFSQTPTDNASKIIASSIKNYSEGAGLSGIKGCGTKYHPRYHFEQDGRPHLFEMKGKEIFKLSSKLLPGFVSDLLETAQCTFNDIKLVIPHQTSLLALKLFQKRLNLTPDQMMITVEKYGNTIASAIPMALHDAIEEKRIQRGDTVLLVGTAAGLSLGGMLLTY